MKNLLAITLLLGSSQAAKIPLTKRELTVANIEYQKEQLTKKYLGGQYGEDVPISDYMNT
jgi:hypothetical protein